MNIVSAPSQTVLTTVVEVKKLGDLRPGDCFHLYTPNDKREEKDMIKELMMVTSPVKDGRVKFTKLNSGETAGKTDLCGEYSQEILVVERGVDLQVKLAKQVPVIAE